VGEALVVAQVEVGLGSIVGDEDLAVLEGGHGARIDVEVGVELHHVDLDAARLQQAADGGRESPLPSDDTTPPVTKMYFADICASEYFVVWIGRACGARLSIAG